MQQGHPVLARPFYQSHPCYTDKFMASMKSMHTGLDGKPMTSEPKESFKYSVTWLSAVGPVVRLELPFEQGIDTV